MNILMLHAAYNLKGGEDVSLHVDANLLRDNGHKVTISSWPNSVLTPVQALTRQVWSREVYKNIRSLVDRLKPNIVDVVNTTWALGPAAIAALYDAGVPIVVRLNNERLCFGFKEFLYAPYNNNNLQSAALVLGNKLHKRTWINKVDCFLAVSQYIQKRMEDYGFDRIFVKPDTVYPAPQFQPNPGKGFLFVGRLCKEKGLHVLLEAWRQMGDMAPHLTIVGDGPFQVLDQDLWSDKIFWAGRVEHTKALKMMSEARALIVPSVWHEPSGRVTSEAQACGTPVIASSAGGISESKPKFIVLRDSPEELKKAVLKVDAWKPSEEIYQRQAVHDVWEKNFGPDMQLNRLITVYVLAIKHSRARTGQTRVGFAYGKLNDPSVEEQLARYDRAKEDRCIPIQTKNSEEIS